MTPKPKRQPGPGKLLSALKNITLLIVSRFQTLLLYVIARFNPSPARPFSESTGALKVKFCDPRLIDSWPVPLPAVGSACALARRLATPVMFLLFVCSV